jgi:hypothetical protein
MKNEYWQYQFFAVRIFGFSALRENVRSMPAVTLMLLFALSRFTFRARGRRLSYRSVSRTCAVTRWPQRAYENPISSKVNLPKMGDLAEFVSQFSTFSRWRDDSIAPLRYYSLCRTFVAAECCSSQNTNS